MSGNFFIGGLLSFFRSGGGGSVIDRFSQKAANTARSNTATLADDPELVVANVAAGIYIVECVLNYNPAAGGFKLGMRTSVAPTADGSTALPTFWVSAGSIGAFTDANTWSTGPAGISNAGVTSGNVQVFMMGSLQIASEATVALQWAQASSNASATTLSEGSFLRLTQISEN